MGFHNFCTGICQFFSPALIAQHTKIFFVWIATKNNRSFFSTRIRNNLQNFLKISGFSETLYVVARKDIFPFRILSLSQYGNLGIPRIMHTECNFQKKVGVVDHCFLPQINCEGGRKKISSGRPWAGECGRPRLGNGRQPPRSIPSGPSTFSSSKGKNSECGWWQKYNWHGENI